MPLVGAVPGALLAGVLVDKVGRRNILISITPICFVCFVAIAFTTELWILDVSRFLLGSMEGATYTALPMYFGEIAEPSIRGVMSASILVGAVFGLLVINILARFMSIYISALVISVIPLVHFFIFMWLPKSPYYLIKIGNLEAAKKNLQRLRSSDDVKINEEFSDITAAVKRQEAAVSNSSWTDLFTQKGNRRAILIFLIVSGTSKYSGANPLMFYTETIFNDAGGLLDPEISAIIFHFIGFLSVALAACMLDRFGRRPMVMISSIGCGCSLALMATYLTLQYLEYEIAEELKCIPLVAMFCYYAIYNLGLCIGPVVFLSEIFPTSVKGYALGMADSTSVIFGTIASKIFHGLTENLGMYSAFWCFSAMAFCGTCLIYAVVPETKGKTLDEIQLELTKSSKSVK